MRALLSHDHPGADRPARKIEVPRHLGDERPVSDPAVLLDRVLPVLVLEREDRVAHRRGDRKAEAEPAADLDTGTGEAVRRTGSVRPDDIAWRGAALRPWPGGRGQALDREVEDALVVDRGVRACRARSQDARERLARGDVVSIEEAEQRVEPEGVLEGASRGLLVGVGDHDRRVEIKEALARKVRACSCCPGALARYRTTLSHERQRSGAHAIEHPPGRRQRRHRAEQARLVPQRPQVADAVRAVRDRDGEIGEHAAGEVERDRLVGGRSAWSQASMRPVKPASSRSSSAPAWETTPSPSAVTLTRARRPLRFTLKVPFREATGSFENPHSSLRNGHFLVFQEVSGRESVKWAG